MCAYQLIEAGGRRDDGWEWNCVCVSQSWTQTVEKVSNIDNQQRTPDNRHPIIINQQQLATVTSDNQQSALDNRHPTTNNKQQTTYRYTRQLKPTVNNRREKYWKKQHPLLRSKHAVYDSFDPNLNQTMIERQRIHRKKT